MKKYAAMALVLVLTLSMAGCFRRKNNETQPTETTTIPSSNYTTEPTTRPTTPPTTMPSNPSSHETVPGTSSVPGENNTTGRNRGNGGM